MDDNFQVLPRKRPSRIGSIFFNLLTFIVLMAIIVVVAAAVSIFFNPYIDVGFFYNPFPPLTVPALLGFPTPTHTTAVPLPDVRTPTPSGTPEPTDTPTQETSPTVDSSTAQALDLPTYLIEIEGIASEVIEAFQDIDDWQISDYENHNKEGFTPHLEKARELFERANNIQPPTEAQAFHDRFNEWGEAAMNGLEEYLLFYCTGDEQYRHGLDQAKQIIYEMQESFYTELRALYTQYDILVPTYGP